MIKNELGFDSVRSTFPVTHKVFPTSVVLTDMAGTQPAIEVVGVIVEVRVTDGDRVGVLLDARVGVAGSLVEVDVRVISMEDVV